MRVQGVDGLPGRCGKLNIMSAVSMIRFYQAHLNGALVSIYRGEIGSEKLCGGVRRVAKI